MGVTLIWIGLSCGLAAVALVMWLDRAYSTPPLSHPWLEPPPD